MSKVETITGPQEEKTVSEELLNKDPAGTVSEDTGLPTADVPAVPEQAPRAYEPQAAAAANVPFQPTALPQEKKKSSHKKMIVCIVCIAVAVVVVSLAAIAVTYFTVIRPNSIYAEAVAALDNSDFYECQRLIDQIPSHKDVPALKKELTYAMAESYINEGNLDSAESLLATLPGEARANELKQDIQYLRAADLAEQGKIDEAKYILDKIPDHADPRQLREQISYESAMDALEKGDYKTAYDVFSGLGDFKDAAKQKETVYYEALAFKSLFNIQSTLKNPASMRVTSVTFYKHPSTEGELNALYEITATNSYGGSLGAYVYDTTLYDGEDDPGMISHSDYADPDGYVELLQQILVDGLKEQTKLDVTVDIARMNRLLEGNASFHIDLPFKAADEVES